MRNSLSHPRELNGHGELVTDKYLLNSQMPSVQAADTGVNVNG